MKAGKRGELFVEVAGQGVLGEEILPFFEVADVPEAASIPVAKGGGAESEEGPACPVAGVVLRLEAGFCEGRDFVPLEAKGGEEGAGGVEHGEAIIG